MILPATATSSRAQGSTCSVLVSAGRKSAGSSSTTGSGVSRKGSRPPRASLLLAPGADRTAFAARDATESCSKRPEFPELEVAGTSGEDMVPARLVSAPAPLSRLYRFGHWEVCRIGEEAEQTRG